VAKKRLEVQAEHHQQAKLASAKDSFDYPLNQYVTRRTKHARVNNHYFFGRHLMPELGNMMGAAGAIIIGPYKHGEITPSIEVAPKLAHDFGVTLNYLVSDKEVSNILYGKAMLEHWQAIDTLTPPGAGVDFVGAGQLGT